MNTPIRAGIMGILLIIMGWMPVAAQEQAEAHAENKDRQPYHLILAENAEDITIEGEGVIDGDGYSFWHKPMRELAK